MGSSAAGFVRLVLCACCRGGVQLGFFVFPGFVVVSRLVMVMGGCVVVSRGLMVMVGARVLVFCHLRFLREVVNVGHRL